MQIIALCIISMSEIAKVIPDITYKWIDENETKFYRMLHELGMDTRLNIERQEQIMHRNRLGEIRECDRWVGQERIDKQWLASGYATQEAIDKASGNRLILDIYRLKGQVE